MTNWQVLQFSGNGNFDPEADTRQAALDFLFFKNRREYSVLHPPRGSLVRQSVFR